MRDLSPLVFTYLMRSSGAQGKYGSRVGARLSPCEGRVYRRSLQPTSLQGA